MPSYHEGQVHIEYQQTLLAQYHGDYDRKQKRLRAVSQPVFNQTPFASPQLVLFELDDEQWVKVRRRSCDRQQKRMALQVTQLSLKNLDIAI